MIQRRGVFGQCFLGAKDHIRPVSTEIRGIGDAGDGELRLVREFERCGAVFACSVVKAGRKMQDDRSVFLGLDDDRPLLLFAKVQRICSQCVSPGRNYVETIVALGICMRHELLGLILRFEQHRRIGQRPILSVTDRPLNGCGLLFIRILPVERGTTNSRDREQPNRKPITLIRECSHPDETRSAPLRAVLERAISPRRTLF